MLSLHPHSKTVLGPLLVLSLFLMSPDLCPWPSAMTAEKECENRLEGAPTSKNPRHCLGGGRAEEESPEQDRLQDYRPLAI